MDLIDRLKSIGDRIGKLKNQVETEEATKNAFVMPFISALGFDVFNPTEVIPEYVADIGIKKGEKVDYCILKEGKPIIIFEVKHWKEGLDPHNSQLFRYFHVTPVKFAILTNGIFYRFYTDLDEPNKMDNKPFLEFSLENISEPVTNELKRFQKNLFNVEEIQNTASDLKYSKEIKEILSSELNEPSEEFVKFFTSKVYSGRATAKVLEQFNELVKKSAKAMISEMISDRLQIALNREKEDQTKMHVGEVTETESPIEESTPDDGIMTTEEETEGFRIVRAILRRSIPVERIALRDTKSYCGVLLDDNNRKPICRFRFNNASKYIGLFDDNKNEEKFPIEKIEDIYNFEERLRETVQNYDKQG